MSCNGLGMPIILELPTFRVIGMTAILINVRIQTAGSRFYRRVMMTRIRISSDIFLWLRNLSRDLLLISRRLSAMITILHQHLPPKRGILTRFRSCLVRVISICRGIRITITILLPVHLRRRSSILLNSVMLVFLVSLMSVVMLRQILPNFGSANIGSLALSYIGLQR